MFFLSFYVFSYCVFVGEEYGFKKWLKWVEKIVEDIRRDSMSMWWCFCLGVFVGFFIVKIKLKSRK